MLTLKHSNTQINNQPKVSQTKQELVVPKVRSPNKYIDVCYLLFGESPVAWETVTSRGILCVSVLDG